MGRIGKGLTTAALVLGLIASTQAQQQRPPKRFDIWEIKLGIPVTAVPDEYIDYACGTNGGPPARPLEGWGDWRKCNPEPSGLREVYFRYDDELEYIARARRDEANIIRYGGTILFDNPVITSILVDDQGRVAGVRALTDPRTDVETRKRGYTVKNFVIGRYDTEGWDCVNLPPAEGETAMGSLFIKDRCEKNYRNEMHVVVESHFYRKAGQAEYNPATREVTLGQFWSQTRFEMYTLAAAPKRK